MGDPLDEAPRIDKDEGRPMGLDLGDNFLVDLAPHLMGSDSAELLVGKLNSQIHVPLVTHVDDLAVRLAVGQDAFTANQKPRHFVDGLLCGAKTDALQRPLGECLESFQRKRQVRPAFVLSDGMDLVHDHRLCRLEKTAATLRRKQNIKRFRSGNQDVGRRAHHGRPFARQRITRAHGHTNFRNKNTFGPRQLKNLGQGLLEILGDIVAESFQRRDIDDVRSVVQLAADRSLK